jgi:thymidylate kinase
MEFVKSVLITFSGIDGAGKSTQIEKLCNHLAAEGVPVRRLSFWDDVVLFPRMRAGFTRRVLQSDGAVGTPEHPAKRKDKNTQTLPLLVGRSILHLLDVTNLCRVVRKAKAREGGVIIFDRYIYDQLAALPMNRWLVRAYARLLLRIAPEPKLSYLLDAAPEVARARKPEYPLDFLRKYRTSYLELRRIAGLQLIAAADPETVHAAIVESFNQCTRRTLPESQVSSALVA